MTAPVADTDPAVTLPTLTKALERHTPLTSSATFTVEIGAAVPIPTAVDEAMNADVLIELAAYTSVKMAALVT